MKAMASDLDGTLLFENKVSQEDLNGIREFRSKGNLFGICSGRPIYGIDDVIKDKMEVDFYIGSSGSVIADHDLNILYVSYIDFSIIKEFYELYKEDYHIFFQAGHRYYTFMETEAATVSHIDSIDELKDMLHPGVSCECKTPEEAIKLKQDIENRFPMLTAHLNIRFLDITMKECSKGNALQKLKEIYSIDTIGGIGDSYNDLTLVQDADAGFTFPYGPDVLKENADYIVDHEYEALKILEEE